MQSRHDERDQSSHTPAPRVCRTPPRPAAVVSPAVPILNSYDPSSIFGNPFLDTLL